MFKHPANVCMTYFSHFKFSMYLSQEFAKASVGAFIHAIHPDILVTKGVLIYIKGNHIIKKK